MDPTTILIGLALICGFYMAWNIGANDVANAMGTSVGSGALSIKWAIIAAAVFEFAGAYFVGANVSSTIRKGIFDPALISDPQVLAMGMIASLLAAGAWLQIASYFGWPVSTTHSIVGAVVGFGCVSVGVTHINWIGQDGQFGGLAKIALSWVISPLLAGSIAYMLFKVIQRSIFYKPDPLAAARKTVPILVFVLFVILAGMTNFKALKHMWKSQGLRPEDPFPLMVTFSIALALGLIAAGIAVVLIRRIDDDGPDDPARFSAVYVNRSLDKATKHLRRVQTIGTGPVQQQATDLLAQVHGLSRTAESHADPALTHARYAKVERIFIWLQVISACFVAFAHGANDVANAIGPLSAAVQALRQGVVEAKAAVPSWALLLGGIGITLGLATWGWRVMQTIGRKITELTPSRGFSAELAAAITILIASLPFAWAKVPISTTHTLVGAVLGVGAARGIGAININVIRDIVAAWVVTIPAGAGLAIVFYYLLTACFT